MPNGKPGDHPLTDILVHGRPTFDDEIDALVCQLAAHPRFAKINEELATILWRHYANADLPELLRQVRECAKEIEP